MTSCPENHRRVDVDVFTDDINRFLGYVHFGREVITITAQGIPIAEIRPIRSRTLRIEIDADTASKLDQARAIMSRHSGVPEADLASDDVAEWAVEQLIAQYR